MTASRLPISSDELAGYPKRLTIDLPGPMVIKLWEDLIFDIAGCIEAWATDRGQVDLDVMLGMMEEAVALRRSIDKNKAPSPVPIEARRSG